MKPIYLSLLLPALVAACANSGANYTPIVDGAPGVAFQGDLASCQQLARKQSQFDKQTGGAALLGIGVGAALGAADDDADALGGAIAGGLAGGAAGALNASQRREGIVRECLRGRGHKVVG